MTLRSSVFETDAYASSAISAVVYLMIFYIHFFGKSSELMMDF